MGQKLICDRCNEEKITSPSTMGAPLVAPGTSPLPKWMQMRISLQPMYITQITVDICPTCCESLNLPTDGRAVGSDNRQTVEDLIRDIAQEIVEDYSHD